MISNQRAAEIVIAYQLYCNNGLCPSCGKSPSDPYRRADNFGYIIEGCVSVHHSVFDYWENRIDAKNWRRQQLRDMLDNWTQADLEMLDDIGPERYAEIIWGTELLTKLRSLRKT